MVEKIPMTVAEQSICSGTSRSLGIETRTSNLSCLEAPSKLIILLCILQEGTPLVSPSSSIPGEWFVLTGVGKCTLAIVMLDEFPDGSLPDQDPYGRYDYDDSDVASFEDLWLSAVLIETCCLTEWLYGWAVGGNHPFPFLPEMVDFVKSRAKLP